jgi:ABC-type lipoprotein release transport system permease subunit
MLLFRPIPWDYGVRNLLRRPARSALTLGALSTVILLVLIVVGFIRGMESTLAVSGDERVVLVHSLGAIENVEYSSVAMSTADLLAASLPDIQVRSGVAYLSPELYMGTLMTRSAEDPKTMGLVRGVTSTALLVRRQAQILEGTWPQAGEILVGRLVAAKLGWPERDLDVGHTLNFEGRTWKISGHLASRGSVFEAEIWCGLEDLQQATKRQDLSLVALTLAPSGKFSSVRLFCKERRQLEVDATRESEYYDNLRKHYRPVRMLAWAIVALVAGAGVFAGLNTMYGAVVGRIKELATLQTIGFLRRAIALSLIQEATLLAAAGTLVASFVAVTAFNGFAVRFTMGAFALRIDATSLLAGCVVGLLLGIVGAVPPAVRALRMPIVDSLKAV